LIKLEELARVLENKIQIDCTHDDMVTEHVSGIYYAHRAHVRFPIKKDILNHRMYHTGHSVGDQYTTDRGAPLP
jgi:hypothetical protein